MPPVLTIKNIDLSQVDFNDLSYSIAPIPESEIDSTLKASIARHGILHPPIVREINSVSYTIIAGRKRLLAWRSLAKEKTCHCLVISRQIPEFEVFHILLAEIQLVRQLTMVEKALFLQKIAAVAEEKQIVKEFLPRLNLAQDPSVMKQTLRLLELEAPILKGIHQGYVNETVARDFVSLPLQDRSILFEIVASLRLSLSNQKKLLQICRELASRENKSITALQLASRENKSITALLATPEVHAILHHPEANPPQKTKNLMIWLARRHKSRSIHAEEEFNRFINEIRLPRNVSVTHTPFFEDDVVTLSITFRNRGFLLQAWEKIKHVTRDNEN
jgi:ParB-like chromosome segregation protein Spo0J